MKKNKPKTIMELKNITKFYGKGAGQVKAVYDVNLKIPENAFMTIYGPSGSGKSTLLNILGLLVNPTKGEVIFKNDKIEITDFNDLADFRLHKLGFVFQAFNLVPVLSVLENVMVPLLIRNDIDEKQKEEKARSLISAVGLSDRIKMKPDELSGGQKQRVAVARALVSDPVVVLADEPTANLDSESAENILQIMKMMNLNSGTAFVFSTHDPRVIKYALQKVTLHDGEIVR